MPRPLSESSRKILGQLGKSAKSLDQLSARTGIRKDRLAKVLWHLRTRGWIEESEEVRKLAVYRRLRDVPSKARKVARAKSAPHIAALNAAFGIGLPVKRARGRVVRGE